MSLIRGGVIFIVYLFATIISFLVMYPFVDAFLTAFVGMEAGEATAELASQISIWQTVITIFFALLLAAPMTWFISYIFHRDPAYSYHRRF